MRYTEELKTEHRAVERMLEVLDPMADRLQAGETLDAKDADDVFEFLSVFVDKCHHGKEESLLFPAMEAAGAPREGGPIGVLLLEHRRGREHVQQMRDLFPGVESGDPDKMSGFAREARRYVMLLRQHIRKEDEVLFPMSEELLDNGTKEQLAVEFDDLEREVVGEGRHEEFHVMLDRLGSKYAKTLPA